jgi:threonyl-tRNA synthetase
MKVILPDSSELELPDGATGLDAARAIGPKLAEQAVLVRQNGTVQDLRAPLRDGEPIQILTTRDSTDPDALAVLRHSAAHLLAEAVRRLYPGVKVAIGPAIENGFYYDFEFPEPIREEDLERIEAEIERELKEGRAWEREEITADEARRRFEAEGERYKVELVETADGEISLYTQGDFTDLCRGPHLQDSKPIKAVKLTSLAGAYWRGDERNTQLTRIYGTAFYSQADLDAHLERLEQARARDHRKLGRELDLVHFDEHSPGSPLWHPKGMAIWNALEDLRRRENARRGYDEVKTPLLYDTELWVTSGHWEKYRENMFLIEQEDKTFGLKPMNCPGHMLLFGSALRSYRDLPVRFAESSTLHRDEPTGTLHGLLRVRHVTQDDAHIFCTRDGIEEEVFGCLDFASYLYDLFGMEARFELSTRPDDKLGTDEEWDFTEAALRAALERDRVRAERGRRRLLRAEDRPAHDRRARPLLADGDDPARRADAAAVRPLLHDRRERGAGPVRDPPGAARVARALHRHPDRALRGRVPLLARPGAGAPDPGRRGASRGRAGAARPVRGGGLPRRRRRARRDARPSNPRGRAREGAVHGGLRRSRVGRVAGPARPRRRAADALARRPARTLPRRGCYACDLKEGADHCPSPSGRTAREGSAEPVGRVEVAAACSGFVVHEEDSTSLVKSL